jgi:hypothetical protein
VRLALVLRELEQLERALDVHLVRHHRRDLRAGGQQRGEVEHQVHLVLGDDAAEEVGVEDGAVDLAQHQLRQRLVERGEVERDDRAVGLAGQACDQAVADFATGAGDEDDGFAQHGMMTPG